MVRAEVAQERRAAGWAPERRDHRRPRREPDSARAFEGRTGTTRAFGVLGIESQENANAFIGACGDHYFNRQGWEPAVDIVTAVP